MRTIALGFDDHKGTVARIQLQWGVDWLFQAQQEGWELARDDGTVNTCVGIGNIPWMRWHGFVRHITKRIEWAA